MNTINLLRRECGNSILMTQESTSLTDSDAPRSDSRSSIPNHVSNYAVLRLGFRNTIRPTCVTSAPVFRSLHAAHMLILLHFRDIYFSVHIYSYTIIYNYLTVWRSEIWGYIILPRRHAVA
jgi:hypothetical protein